MTTERLNDAPVLDQLEGQWQKIAMAVIFKFVGSGVRVNLHADDFMKLAEHYAPGIPVLFTHGHANSLDLMVIDHAAAMRIAEHQKSTESGSVQ